MPGKAARSLQISELSEIDELAAGIKKLGRTKALAFGIFLLERAMPAFFKFQRDTGCPGGGAMRAALAQCWAVLEGSSAETANFVSVSECERVMPDSEGRHASDYTSAAIDAVDIACNMLIYARDADVELIVRSVTARCDTIELFLQNLEPIDPHLSHPMLMEELDFMQADLEFLQAIGVDKSTLSSVVLERVSVREYGSLRLKLS